MTDNIQMPEMPDEIYATIDFPLIGSGRCWWNFNAQGTLYIRAEKAMPRDIDLEELKREVSKHVFNAEFITNAASRIVDFITDKGYFRQNIKAEKSNPVNHEMIFIHSNGTWNVADFDGSTRFYHSNEYYEVIESARQMGVAMDFQEAHHEVHHAKEKNYQDEIALLKSGLEAIIEDMKAPPYTPRMEIFVKRLETIVGKV